MTEEELVGYCTKLSNQMHADCLTPAEFGTVSGMLFWMWLTATSEELLAQMELQPSATNPADWTVDA